jgi:LysW-gamma-L-alpha-aminoadipyl-6-phosphate/LysW-L-glutamyl-5-phosphate reductase
VVRVAIVGAGGYVGGELLRILLGHPAVEVVAVTSARFAGRPVDSVHPNLRAATRLRFIDHARLDGCDVLFLAVPNGESMAGMARFAELAKQVVDLSADFRLREPAQYKRYYRQRHAAPEVLDSFVCGLPELHRAELHTADRVSVPGCMATAAIIALHPLRAAGMVEDGVDVDGRTGSSGSGAGAGPRNDHAVRSRAMRVFAPVRHRHEAEIAQATGMTVRMTATGVEAVRGVQVLCRVRLVAGVDERAVRAAYRRHYAAEPFVRVVAQRRGLYRYPDPKVLAGSNFCDVGFALDEATGHAVAIAALDNLVKGGAGNAVQCMNIRHGWPERLGLEFPGLHPV